LIAASIATFLFPSAILPANGVRRSTPRVM
jgi:hypothetical protein